MTAHLESLSPLLALLQLNDSAFPAGTFAHSYGLEQAVRDQYVRDAADVDRFVTSVLRMQLAGADMRALVVAAGAARAHNVDAVCATDRRLFATKAAEELRAASTAAGASVLREVAAHEGPRAGVLSSFLAEVEAGRTPGTHPVAFAVAGAAFGLEGRALAAASLLAAASALWAAAMRLLSVSHRDVQGALHRLRPQIDALVPATVEAEQAPFTSFHPLQEIASMRHRTAAVRLFAS